jgi:hypothetical protein
MLSLSAVHQAAKNVIALMNPAQHYMGSELLTTSTTFGQQADGTFLQGGLQPLGVHSVLHGQIRHQITRQKFTWVLQPDLTFQILHRDPQIRVRHPRSKALDPRRDLVDQGVHVRDGDRLSGVQTRNVPYPLPELHPRNLCCRRVLHEVVQRDAPVATNPRCSVCERSGDIGAHAFIRDGTGYERVEQFRSGDTLAFTTDMIL